MIRYTLKCAKGHDFDGWFASAAAFDKLHAAGMVACTLCGATEVEKALMAPALRADERPRSQRDARAEALAALGIDAICPTIRTAREIHLTIVRSGIESELLLDGDAGMPGWLASLTRRPASDH